MSNHQELVNGGVLRVTVHHVYYPVTEETLQQVFIVYGVVKISVFQRINYVEAVVQLRSRHAAARALAMHGRCIYERACLLDIQDVSPEYNLQLCSLLEQKQTTTVAEYTAAFWECVHRVLDLNPNLSIKTFVHHYIEGLREDIQDVVRSRSPLSITGASSLARIREDEIVQEAAMVAEKLDDGHGVHILMPTVIIRDVFLDLTAQVECDADHDIITIDKNNLAASTPITCSTECLSHAAAVHISPGPATSALCEETLEIEAISVATPTSVVCSIVGLTDADVNSYVAVPLIVWSVNPFSATPPKVLPTLAHRSFSIPKLNAMASTRCWRLCFDHIGALTPMYMLDENVNMKEQAHMLRPMPWPSFKCYSEATSPQGPRPATQQWRSSHRACQSKCMKVGDAILNTELKAQVLFTGILADFVRTQTGRVCDFLRTFAQEEKLNSISEASEQALRLFYVELIPWAYSSLHFIKPCSSGPGMQRCGATGRLSPKVPCSTINIMFLPRDTTQLRSWPPPRVATKYGGTLLYKTTGMLWFPSLINQVHWLWKSPWPPPGQEQTSESVEVNHGSKNFVDCVGHGVQGLTPKETLTGVSSELASPVMRGADNGVVVIDTSSLAAPALTTCLKERPSRDATVNIFPELAASDVCYEAINTDIVSIMAPPPATCSKGLIHDGINDPVAVQMLRPSPWPSFITEHKSTACSSIIEPPLSAATASCTEMFPNYGEITLDTMESKVL
ncbi:hypothetical protein ACQJBY_001706 [Aegilops geniculata]